MISALSRSCSERRHTAHKHLVEGRIYYRFHPRCGETVLIKRQLEHRGVVLVVILQPDSSLACIPLWMTHEAAAQYTLSEKPHFSVDILRSLRAEINARWVSSRPAFLLPVRVLSKLFRRLFLTRLLELHTAGRLAFFGDHAGLREERAFTHLIARLRKKNWVVYAKPPFGGPEAVLAYLSRYTHRVAISNRRLISLDENGVTFRYNATRIITATVPNAIAQ